MRGGLGLDLGKVLEDLHAQKQQLERTITALKAIYQGEASAPAVLKRRRRHSMGAAERQEVAARLKRYWTSR